VLVVDLLLYTFFNCSKVVAIDDDDESVIIGDTRLVPARELLVIVLCNALSSSNHLIL
jgi:hypothetical protein